MGGESPISYMVMSQYARDHGLTLDEFEQFRRFIGILDGIHLEIERLKATARKAEPT
ncbi:hypothetical protein [Rhizobium sp. Leaf383]|uniref:phage tail assembly chaperone n=1 Tax=Rhizobium sp. Leaf383 TaxID=1736357 RepID=UPI000A721210|nr:hypothetical protein [Rhizobium sp. Leaf383]